MATRPSKPHRSLFGREGRAYFDLEHRSHRRRRKQTVQLPGLPACPAVWPLRPRTVLLAKFRQIKLAQERDDHPCGIPADGELDVLSRLLPTSKKKRADKGNYPPAMCGARIPILIAKACKCGAGHTASPSKAVENHTTMRLASFPAGATVMSLPAPAIHQKMRLPRFCPQRCLQLRRGYGRWSRPGRLTWQPTPPHLPVRRRCCSFAPIRPDSPLRIALGLVLFVLALTLVWACAPG